MKQEANWYGLDMLPTYLMMGKAQLREAKEQLSDILKTDNNFKSLIEINEKILELAKKIKKWTIDSVLIKTDVELGLAYLLNEDGIFR